MRRRFDTAAIAGIGLVVALLIANAGIAYRNMSQLISDAKSMAHTNHVLDLTSEMLRNIVDAETGQRGFIITGQEKLLDPYNAAMANVDSQLSLLETETEANPEQAERVKQLRPLVAQRMASLKEGIDLRRKSDNEAQASVAAGGGKKQMDEIRDLITSMRHAEQRLRLEREGNTRLAYRVAIATELLTTALALILFGACVYLIDRNLREQRRSAAEIRQEREWLRVTITSIGDGVIATDMDGRITLMNQVAQDLTGWSQVAATGKPISEVFRIVNESTRAPAENPVSRTIREGAVVGLANHTTLMAHDGAERPIADSSAPIRDQSGKIIGAVLVFRDVTEERLVERNIRESDARKRAILEAALDCILTVDRHGKIIELNPACERILGCNRDVLLGRELADVLIPESRRSEHRKTMAGFLAGQDPASNRRFEIVGMRCDGSEFPAELTVTRIVTDHGPLLTAYVRDITDQTRVERKLADALQFANGIVETVQIPLLVLTADLHVKSANRSFFATYRTDPEETIGRRFAELSDGQWNDSELLDLLQEVAAHDQAFADYEIEQEFSRIGKRVMLLSASRIHREDESSDLILLAIEDITTRKRSEETIVELLAREQRRAERLQQLAAASLTINSANSESSVVNVAQMEAVRIIGAARAEVAFDGASAPEMDGSLTAPLLGRNGRILGQIRLSTKPDSSFDHDDRAIATQLAHMVTVALDNVRLYEELRAADRRKDEFLATLAHELRNPLAAVRNSLQVMRMAGDNSELLEESRGMIERQAQQLIRLVDDLMDISRITRGKLELRKERINLADAIASAVETGRPLIDEMGHQLTLSIPPEPIMLDADLTRLAQVFLNLLNNSAKYSKQGGHITIAAEPRDNHVVVRVRDRGIGISEEMLSRVFDMFTQADRSLHRSQGGLGIGLTLVR